MIFEDFGYKESCNRVKFLIKRDKFSSVSSEVIKKNSQEMAFAKGLEILHYSSTGTNKIIRRSRNRSVGKTARRCFQSSFVPFQPDNLRYCSTLKKYRKA